MEGETKEGMIDYGYEAYHDDIITDDLAHTLDVTEQKKLMLYTNMIRDATDKLVKIALASAEFGMAKLKAGKRQMLNATEVQKLLRTKVTYEDRTFAGTTPIFGWWNKRLNGYSYGTFAKYALESAFERAKKILRIKSEKFPNGLYLYYSVNEYKINFFLRMVKNTDYVYRPKSRRVG